MLNYAKGSALIEVLAALTILSIATFTTLSLTSTILRSFEKGAIRNHPLLSFPAPEDGCTSESFLSLEIVECSRVQDGKPFYEWRVP